MKVDEGTRKCFEQGWEKDKYKISGRLFRKKYVEGIGDMRD